MKDEEIKFEEIEVSHTPGGTGRYYVSVIHLIHQSHGRRHTMSGSDKSKEFFIIMNR